MRPQIHGPSADFIARQELDRGRVEMLRTLFANAELVTKPSILLQTASSLASSVGFAVRSVSAIPRSATRPAPAPVTGEQIGSSLSAAKELVHELLLALFDAQTLADVLGEVGDVLTQSILDEVIGAFVPLVGTTATGARAIRSWTQAAWAGWKEYKTSKQKADVLPGDALAAAEALQRMLKREVTRNALIAGRLTAKTAATGTLDAFRIAGIAGCPAFGAGSALIVAGQVAGPVVGAVNAITALIHDLFLLARDYKEKRAANKLLKNPAALDHRLFDASPVIGCYYLANADTGSLVRLLSRDLGSAGWKDRVLEQCRRSIWKLQEKAVDLIRDHRFELKGVAVNRGDMIRGGMFCKTRRYMDHKQKQLVAAVKSPFQ